MKSGFFLRFYLHEADRHDGRLVWEWLLERANELGIGGGSAFRSMAGFGHHRVLHENRFFELAGTSAVEVEFIVTDEELGRLLSLIETAGIRVFYARIPAEFSVMNPGTGELPQSAPQR